MVAQTLDPEVLILSRYSLFHTVTDITGSIAPGSSVSAFVFLSFAQQPIGEIVALLSISLTSTLYISTSW